MRRWAWKETSKKQAAGSPKTAFEGCTEEGSHTARIWRRGTSYQWAIIEGDAEPRQGAERGAEVAMNRAERACQEGVKMEAEKRIVGLMYRGRAPAVDQLAKIRSLLELILDELVFARKEARK